MEMIKSCYSIDNRSYTTNWTIAIMNDISHCCEHLAEYCMNMSIPTQFKDFVQYFDYDRE